MEENVEVIQGKSIVENENQNQPINDVKEYLGLKSTENDELLTTELGDGKLQGFLEFLIEKNIKELENQDRLKITIDCYKDLINVQTKEKENSDILTGVDLEDIKIERLEENVEIIVETEREEVKIEEVAAEKSEDKIENNITNVEETKNLDKSTIEPHTPSPNHNSSVISESSPTLNKKSTASPTSTSNFNSPVISESSPILKNPSHRSENLTFDNSIPVYLETYELSSLNLQDNEISTQLTEIIMSYSASDNEMYTVTSYPFNWIVKRKASDFAWLRRKLVSAYPGVYIPPSLPKMTGKTKEVILYKSQCFLQRFIVDIQSQPLLKRSPYFYGFLKETSFENFKLLRKRSKKLKSPEKIENIYSIDGVSYCDSSRNPQFSKNLSEYINITQIIQKNIKRLSEQLEEQLKNTQETINSMSSSFKELAKVQEMLPFNKPNQEIFSSFASVVDCWERVGLERVKTIKDHFYTFFKYSYNEVLPLKDLLKDRESWLQELIKAEKRLIGKKEKLWEQGDPRKWWDSSDEMYLDIEKMKNDKDLAFSKMFNKETLQLDQIKNMYGYFNYKIQSETLRFLKHSAEKNSRNLKEYASHESNGCLRIKQAWEAFVDKLTSFDGY